MPDVPFMRMWWGDFFADPKVAALPGETRGIYACLLGAMWQNGGWLANNDSMIARLLGLHVLTWKARHKPLVLPLLSVGVTPMVPGGVLTQKRLTKEWRKATQLIEENHSKAAKARAAKAAKSTKQASVTEPQTPPVTEPLTRPVTEIVTEPVKALQPEPEPDKNRPLPSQAERPILSPLQDLGALPPRERRVNGKGVHSASPGSPSLKGGSPVKPSPALLKSKLVNTPLDEDDGEVATRSGGTSLFGALEAAIRHGKPEEDE